jgi:asparagine synthase (glutamine-hydrolysing)
VDLSEAGIQPLWNEDRTVCVLVNGEIYNFDDLRRRLISRGHRFRSGSDSEVVVHLYEDHGMRGCCQALEGMFAFALWDSRTRDLYLGRDRLGIKPLVVAEHAAGVTFGSTMRELLADPEVPRDLRDEAFVALMRWGFVPTPWSALSSARHVLPGSFLRVREGRVVEETTWWVDAPGPASVTPEEALDAVQRAVCSHLVADVPVGVLLSGGIDSGIITALAARAHGRRDIDAWTVSHHGYPEDEYPDAKRTAQHIGVRLHEVPIGGEGVSADVLGAVVDAMDEPLAVSSLVGLHALFRAIAPYRRVVLAGDGADELFAGYDWHAGMPRLPWWSHGALFRAAAPLLSRAHPISGPAGHLTAAAKLVQRHPALIYLDKLRINRDEELSRMGLSPLRDDPMERRAVEIWDRFAAAGTLEQMLAVERGTSLVDEMLAKIDTASMAHSVEARVPFLADGVVAVAKGLSADQKRTEGLGKWLLRRWFAQLGPPGADSRAKTGFNSPVWAWLHGPAGEYLRVNSYVGSRLLGIDRLPTTPRTVFTVAVIGAWSGSLVPRSGDQTRLAS